MDKQTNREVEGRGPTVEAAITDGLQKISLRRDQVNIEVIDEGSRGLLGIGSREAVVRLRPLEAKPATPAEPAQAATPAPLKEDVTAKPAEKPAPTPAPKPAPKAVKPAASTDAADLEREQEAAVAVMVELLDKMLVDAEVSARLSEPDDLTGQQVNIIDILGDDLGVLIGPRGETLEALQYLARLIVAHQLQQRANFVVDVEGYRERREQALVRLAERMADKARERGQPVSLEPMSSYERRVIHMALRDAPDVYTESTGEGKYRKVRIFPKGS